MRTIVRVRVEQDGRPAVISRTTEHDDAAGLLDHRFDAELRRIIQDSRVFGRLRKQAMFAFTSKYAPALYEMGEKRRNMQFRWTEIFELKELRELLGVKSDELRTFGNLNAWCLKPAAQEVNGFADFGVAFRPIKTARKVTAVQMAWWRKNEEEVKAAFAEVQRHRTGRRARDAEALLRLLHRWREEAVKAGQTVRRIAAAFEAGLLCSRNLLPAVRLLLRSRVETPGWVIETRPA